MKDQNGKLTTHVSGFKVSIAFQAITTLVMCALVVMVVSQRKNTISAIAANQRAVTYVCNTTAVLDQLTITGAQHIRASFSNGEYEVLVKKGILTEKDVKNSKDDLANFNKAHKLLQSNAACVAVGSKPQTLKP